MQSKLGETLTRTARVFQFKFFSKRTFYTAPSTGRPSDPAIHSGGSDVEADPAPQQPEQSPKKKGNGIGDGEGPIVPPKAPYASSPNIQSTPVNPPADPIGQQKRRHNTAATASASAAALEEVTCTGPDPWVEEEKGFERQRKEQEEDDIEYFKHHKASPLSELQIADTRKPISRATDTGGTAGGGASYYGDGGGGSSEGVWRPEQLDTAEEALLRTARIWRENAMNGDPESPHGRVLRALRRETW